MNWFTHPDTLTNAQAEGIASRSGNVRGSVKWLKAYRAAYASLSGADAEPYLADLDTQIAQAETPPKG